MPKFILYIDTPDETPEPCRNIGCFLLDSSLPADFSLNFAAAARAQGALVLAAGDNAAAFCQKLDLDGALFDLSRSENPVKEFKSLQKQLGAGAVCGVISRSRRHEAMLLSECEPDFLGFKIWSAGNEGTLELVAWYNDLFLIQSALWIMDDDVDIGACQTDNIIIDNRFYKILLAKNKRID